MKFPEYDGTHQAFLRAQSYWESWLSGLVYTTGINSKWLQWLNTEYDKNAAGEADSPIVVFSKKGDGLFRGFSIQYCESVVTKSGATSCCILDKYGEGVLDTPIDHLILVIKPVAENAELIQSLLKAWIKDDFNLSDIKARLDRCS